MFVCMISVFIVDLIAAKLKILDSGFGFPCLI